MPQLKIYEAKEPSNSWLPRDTYELLGVRQGRGQGSYGAVGVLRDLIEEVWEAQEELGLEVDREWPED